MLNDPEVAARWSVFPRQHPNLLEHICALRQLDYQALTPDFIHQLHDPNLLPGMKEARRVIKTAHKKKWHVTIFGDYDADGTPAAALLSTVLNQLGIDHQVILPTREEGYGLRAEVVEKIAGQSQLLITVDTGVTAVEEIALARQKGMAVIVLDHHLPKAELPDAILIDPFLANSSYPFANLCGCALAYKFAEALAEDFPSQLNEGFRKWLLDLVAISTVADMMVMRGENRVLVHYGLQVLKKTRRPGLIALMETAGLEPAKLSATSLGYVIGPRLNAAGRLSSNRPAFDLLMAKNLTDARKLAEEIEQANRTRQELVAEVTKEAEQLLVGQNSLEDRCLIIVKENWPAGVLGLVAGRLASKYFRPTILLSDHDGRLTGSARSVGDYSIIDGLDSQKKQLLRYGGHRQAAGLALDKKNVIKFVDGLKAHAAQLISKDQLIPTFRAEAILTQEEVTLEIAELLEELQPYGLENTNPLFIIQDVTLSEPKRLGAGGDHLKWSSTVGSTQLEIIGFGLAKTWQKRPIGQAHLLGHLEVNTWQNRSRLQLRLIDFQPTDHPILTAA